MADPTSRRTPQSEPPACPKCGARGELLHALSKMAAFDYWRCPACGETWTTPKRSSDFA